MFSDSRLCSFPPHSHSSVRRHKLHSFFFPPARNENCGGSVTRVVAALRQCIPSGRSMAMVVVFYSFGTGIYNSFFPKDSEATQATEKKRKMGTANPSLFYSSFIYIAFAAPCLTLISFVGKKWKPSPRPAVQSKDSRCR